MTSEEITDDINKRIKYIRILGILMTGGLVFGFIWCHNNAWAYITGFFIGCIMSYCLERYILLTNVKELIIDLKEIEDELSEVEKNE